MIGVNGTTTHSSALKESSQEFSNHDYFGNRVREAKKRPDYDDDGCDRECGGAPCDGE